MLRRWQSSLPSAPAQRAQGLPSGMLAGVQSTQSPGKGTQKWTTAQVSELSGAHLTVGNA